MPYNDKLAAVFLHIPKTGGTTVKSLLDISQLNSEDPNLIPSPQHLTCTMLRERMGAEKYDRYFKFTFIRNPWGRLLSDYFWRQAAPRRKLDMTFPEFTELASDVVENGHYYRDRFADHFIPQVEFTRDVDAIYRFEKLEQGLLSAAVILDVDVGRVPAKQKKPHDEYWRFYDSASRSRIEDLYREDIETFGYEFGS